MLDCAPHTQPSMFLCVNPTTRFPNSATEMRIRTLIETHNRSVQEKQARAALIEARQRAIQEAEDDFRFGPMVLEDELAEGNALYTPCVVPQGESKEAEQRAICASFVMASETAVEEDCMFALMEEPIRVEEPDEVDVAYQQRVAQIVHELWLEEVAAYEREREMYSLEQALEGEADVESFNYA
jgi:DNA-binding protein H-NS